MDITVIFQFEESSISTLDIQCRTDTKMNLVLEKLKNKANTEGKIIELKDYIFSFNDIEISKDLTVAQIKKNHGGQYLVINARKKIKIMKCPNCIGNTCFINMVNYGLKFSGCKNKEHKPVIKNFANYYATQKIDYAQIICQKCNKNQKEEKKEFYKCLKCTQKNKKTAYYCDSCAKNHGQGTGEKHFIVKYSDKNYICSIHCKEFSSYCTKCEQDLCNDCEKNHKGTHEIIKYDSVIPKVKIIKNDLEKIKEKTAQARNDIIQLKNMIEEAVGVLDKYYDIAMDLIEKYETYNTQLRNFHVISNINSLADSNKKVFEDLEQILIDDRSKDDYLKRCEKLIDIYISNKEIYLGGAATESQGTANNSIQGDTESNYFDNANNYKMVTKTQNEGDKRNINNRPNKVGKKPT